MPLPLWEVTFATILETEWKGLIVNQLAKSIQNPACFIYAGSYESWLFLISKEKGENDVF